MRASRISYRAEQLIESVFCHQPAMRPLPGIERSSAGLPPSLTAPMNQQPHEPQVHVTVNLVELARGITRPEVTTPSAQHRIQSPDDFADVFHARPTA